MATQKTEKMGKTKKTTDNLIDDAVASQQDWLERRRSFADKFFRSLNVFAKPSRHKAPENDMNAKNRSVLREYWFPILCAFIVIFLAIWMLYRHVKTVDVRSGQADNVIVNNGDYVPAAPQTQAQPQPTEPSEPEIKNPSLDDVRVDNGGKVSIAGKWRPNTGVSVFMNDKLVATIMADANGNFMYRLTKSLDSGNYTFYLMDANSQTKSDGNVFVYVSEPGVTESELIFPKHKMRVNVTTK